MIGNGFSLSLPFPEPDPCRKYAGRLIQCKQARHCIRRWRFIPMGIRVIPIPVQGDSHSFPSPFPIVSSIPILMGLTMGMRIIPFPWSSLLVAIIKGGVGMPSILADISHVTCDVIIPARCIADQFNRSITTGSDERIVYSHHWQSSSLLLLLGYYQFSIVISRLPVFSRLCQPPQTL